MLAKADAVVDRTFHGGHGVPMLWRASVVRGVGADGEVMRVAKCKCRSELLRRPFREAHYGLLSRSLGPSEPACGVFRLCLQSRKP